MNRIVVVGAGLGGLSAACTLAARGYSVTLLERNPWLGGKACLHEQGGFRFDMGPTILTLPSVFRRVFAEADLNLEERLDLRRLDPQWRCFFDDGTYLDLIENVEAMATNLGRYSPHPGDVCGYRRFIALAEQLHAISRRFFFYRPVGTVRNILQSGNILNLESLKSFLSMRPTQTVAETIRSFVKDERVAQMLDHFTQYVGSAPDTSPAVLCGIAHMQTDEGVWYPMGGTRAVPVALEKLARELGVDIRTECQVSGLELTRGRVSAVRLAGGERVDCGAVVANSDSVRTFRELIGGRPAQRFLKQRTYEPACSGVVLYLGLNRTYPQLAHHDFVFSRDPEEEFEAIYRQGEPAPDPTCYLAVPSRTEPEVAPPGKDALYVLVHTPYLRDHHDWSRMLPDYRRSILRKLETTAGLEGIEQAIEVERVLTPQDIHDRYAVLNGAIYGLASHGKLNGAFKPSNRTEIDGLYLAGGSAHPGPGMPMVTMSGWIAADTLDRDRVVPRTRGRQGLAKC